jgi:hypothetical protein
LIVNNSVLKPNWTQLNNKYEPLSTCNVTACINAAQSAGYDVEGLRRGLAERPADDLLLFIQKNELCNQLWIQLDPKKTIPINQWIAVLALGLSLWIGKDKSAWFEMTTSDKMRDCILNGGACVISGRYETKKGYIDHITAMVGIDVNDDKTINSWIMDDSYGDYRTKYESKLGDNIVMSNIDFIALVKEQKNAKKRCIFVPKMGAV